MELGDVMPTSNPHASSLAGIYSSILENQRKNSVFLTSAMSSTQSLGFFPSYGTL